MSDLHELLTEAVPPLAPGFDEADIRARVAARAQRDRRVVSGIAAIMVLLVVAGLAAVSPGGRNDLAEPGVLGPLLPISESEKPPPSIPAAPAPPTSSTPAPSTTPDTTATPPTPTATRPTPTPTATRPTAAEPTPAADRLLDALGRSDDVVGIPTVQREGTRTAITVELAADRAGGQLLDLVVDELDALAGRPPPTADTDLLLVGDGEAAILADGALALSCIAPADVSLLVTGPGEERLGLADLTGVMAAAIGCTPRPPGTADGSIREARLAAAITALGTRACCGEPSHGSADAATGLVWEGAEVMLNATTPRTRPPGFQTGRVVPLADGEADAGDGDGLPGVDFDCGDTRYRLVHDSPVDEVHLRAATALAGQLGCTPRVPR